VNWNFLRDEKMTDTALLSPGLENDALATARSMIGMPIRIEQWNYEASRDSIRHYAWGLGDDNPLYSDPEYAKSTRWGGIIAPPTFMYGVFDAVIAPGLPDIQWIYSGTDWFFYEPARRNDEITAHGEYVDAKELSGSRVAKMLVQTGEVTYTNQHGRRVARALSHTFRIARQSAAGGLKLEPRNPHVYTQAELDDIGQAMLNEYRRGANTLYWEDVKVGDVLPGTTRGPINQMDMTCYYAGSVGTSGYKSTKLRRIYAEYARKSPERLPNNYDASYYGAAVSPSIGHQDKTIAVKEIGMPGPYDNGPQRIGMCATCVTNWMGDDGFMREHSIRVKQPVIFGDTTFTGGKVTGKRIDGGLALVDCEVWAKNQFGQVTASGRSVVELPRRPAE
jgi:acyl dehydratase